MDRRSRNGKETSLFDRFLASLSTALISFLFVISSSAEEPRQDPEQSHEIADTVFIDTAIPNTANPNTVFTDEILVQWISVQARAVDFSGAPLVGLGPEDFHVEVGGKEVPIEAVDWMEAGPRLDSHETSTDEAEPTREIQPRLIVLFVQSSPVAHRAVGLQWTARRIDTVLHTLHPTDRVAVVEYRHHIHLRADFTRNRREITRAVEDAVLLRPPRHSLRRAQQLPEGSPSLAAHLDEERASRADFVENGLEVTAEALEKLPGEKLLLFLGWGLGAEHGGHPTPSFRSAVRALHRAEVTVSSLAVGGLMYNRPSNLDESLEMIATATGGTHAKLNPFLDLALSRLSHSLAGHYLVTFVAPPRLGSGKVRITLRHRKEPVRHKPLILKHRQEPTSADT